MCMHVGELSVFVTAGERDKAGFSDFNCNFGAPKGRTLFAQNGISCYAYRK